MPKITASVSPLLGALLLFANASLTSAQKSMGASILPASVAVESGKTQQFKVGGAFPLPVKWTVNGIAGGNVAVGTVTDSGLYTAPAIIPDSAIELGVIDAHGHKAPSVATVTVLENPEIVKAHRDWLKGVSAAAPTFGCKKLIIQQDSGETVADAIQLYVLTAVQGDCLVLTPISADTRTARYSFARGGRVDGLDIYYISDVGRARIRNGQPVSPF